ncbi:helix-turn-helix domain-containing protein [Nonomuraea sp. NPDC050328]|uniref:helix-turn-helix domain-containing protein n=1 Tax=Nonomuraea sp. NPDC050328 TaxID=3364361 RepID=UPI0037907865
MTHPTPEYERIGATIRALSEAYGWKVGTLAHALKFSHAYVSNVMAGRKRPTVIFCRRFADLLRVPLAAIISSEEYARAEAADAEAQAKLTAGVR